MRFARQLLLWLPVLGLLTARPTLAEDPAKPASPSPTTPAVPVLPDNATGDPALPNVKRETDDTGKSLPLGIPDPRLAPPPSLLPEEIPIPEARPAATRPPARGKPGSTVKPPDTAADLDMRIRYSKARNIAETNEAVRSAWEATRHPKNDEQKRKALKRYYDVLFSRMLSMDRGISPLVEKRHKAEIATLTQKLIAPTVPNE